MTEARFSYTVKFNDNLLTVRGDTGAEFIANMAELQNIPSVAALVNALSGAAPAPTTTAQAVANLDKAFGTVDVESDKEVREPWEAAPAQPQAASSLEEKTDKFGNKYVKGSPTQSCSHGPRVVKHGTSKAGKKYKAQVCLNDSPFGDWRQDKCEPVFG